MVVAQFALNSLCETAYGHDRVSNLMGNTLNQMSHGHQTLGANELFLRDFEFLSRGSDFILHVLVELGIFHGNDDLLCHAHKQFKFNALERFAGFLVEHLEGPHGFISKNKGHTDHGPGLEAGHPIKLVTESLFFAHILEHHRFSGLDHITGDAFTELKCNRFKEVYFFAASDTDHQFLFLFIEFIHRAGLCADEFLSAFHRTIKDIFYVERGDDEGAETEYSRQFFAIDIFGGLFRQVGTTLVTNVGWILPARKRRPWSWRQSASGQQRNPPEHPMNALQHFIYTGKCADKQSKVTIFRTGPSDRGAAA